MSKVNQSYLYEYRAISIKNEELKIYSNLLQTNLKEEVSFDIKNKIPTALDYFNNSLIGSIIYAIKDYDNRQKKDIENIEIKAKFTLTNPLSKIGVIGTEELESKISHIKLDIYIENNYQIDDLFDYCQKAICKSIIYNTIKNEVIFEINVTQI